MAKNRGRGGRRRGGSGINQQHWNSNNQQQRGNGGGGQQNPNNKSNENGSKGGVQKTGNVNGVRKRWNFTEGLVGTKKNYNQGKHQGKHQGKNHPGNPQAGGGKRGRGKTGLQGHNSPLIGKGGFDRNGNWIYNNKHGEGVWNQKHQKYFFVEFTDPKHPRNTQHNSKNPKLQDLWSRPPRSPKHPPTSQSVGRPLYENLRDNPWWSVISKDLPFQLLRGRFDTSKDPPKNPFTHHTPDQQRHFRHPLEVEFENLIGWQDVVHEYIAKDNPGIEASCSTCVALAQQLLVVKTGVLGAPDFPIDSDMKSPGLIEPETMNVFLDQVIAAVRARNGQDLCDVLQIEPPFSPPYEQLILDLRRRYPAENDRRLEAVCEERIKDFLDEQDLTWGAFPIFLREYFRFIRDVDVTNLVITHAKLMALLKQCNYALGDSTLGIVVLPTVLQYSKLLTKLTIGLDNRPELIAHLRRQSLSSAPADDGENKTSLVEDSANVIREAFSKCLNDRTGGGSGRTSKPEGKRVGIYATANMCLKLFIQCKKLDNAQQMFTSISQQAPPLSLYPKAQRVTYLYYLGRYMFANSHFYRALLTLEGAYSQCHSSMVKNRRLILVYLVASNMILGRRPSASLFSRKEAEGLIHIFGPIQNAISKGDICSFRRLTSLDGDSPIAEWLLQKRMLLQIRNRCELLVWRSLARKVLILGGFHGADTSKVMPNFYLSSLLAAATFLEQRAAEPDPILQPVSGNATKSSSPFGKTLTPMDFGTPKGLFSPNTPTTPTMNRGVLYPGYVAPEFDPSDCWEPYTPDPDMPEVESVLASLIDQRLIQGSLTRGDNPRLGISGAKGTLRGALRIGWPKVWETLKAKAEEDGDEIPGWVRTPHEIGASGMRNGMSAFEAGPRTVVNLTGARPVGSGPSFG